MNANQLREASERFHEHRGFCLKCGDWKRVAGRPSQLCPEGKKLWDQVVNAEDEAHEH